MMQVIAETQNEHDRFTWIPDHIISRGVEAIVTAGARATGRWPSCEGPWTWPTSPCGQGVP